MEEFLSEVEFNEYDESDGTKCPVCGGKNLVWGFLEWTSDGAYGHVFCNTCLSKWIEGMKRHDVLMLEVKQCGNS